MDPAEIVGYCDRPSLRPGETVRFMVSTRAGHFEARLLKLGRRADLHRRVQSAVDGRYPGRPQSLAPGSCIRFAGEIPVPQAPHLTVKIFPTRPARGEDQAILCWDGDSGLFLDREGRVEFRWSGSRLASRCSLQAQRWYGIEAHLDPGSAMMRLTLRGGDFDSRDTVSMPMPMPMPRAGAGRPASSFCIAACLEEGRARAHFDGKIERPKIASADGATLAEWDLAREPHSSHVVDVGPAGLHGRTVNRPRRAATGAEWAGKIMHFAEAPQQYGAIAFHSDDLTDADWEESCALTLPEDLPSGIYGLEIEANGKRDCIPFIVRPAAGTRPAPTAFLVPTFSYLAYANERHWWGSPAVEAIAGAPLGEILGAADRWAARQQLLSVYDLHGDGSGCCHSSWRRPLVNIRAGYVHPLLRGPHQLSADLYVTDWLEHAGRPVDLLTDHDLHREGYGALEGYQVVITGSHPEYASAQMLDALERFAHGGGKIMYLGGNGFYAVTSVFEDDEGTIEVRRGRYGIIPWFSEPGEMHHAATGEPCGQWRLRGRAPQRLFGIGMAGVAFGAAEPYQRTAESRASGFEWVFAGVQGEQIHARGDLMGGPAGFEFDRIDHALGSPYSTVRLATATGFKDFAVMLADDSPLTGYIGDMRSDVSYLEYPGGGAVFAAGSVTWSTCLMADGGDNDVARVTANVLDHFLND